jgi:hypothetical protein
LFPSPIDVLSHKEYRPNVRPGNGGLGWKRSKGSPKDEREKEDWIRWSTVVWGNVHAIRMGFFFSLYVVCCENCGKSGRMGRREEKRGEEGRKG